MHRQMIVALPGTKGEVAEKTGIDAGKVKEALKMKVVRPPELIPEQS